MRITAILAVLLISGVISGCGNNRYLLTSQFVVTTQEEASPELVNNSSSYRNDAPKIKTVAVKAPDTCSNRTADQRSGAAVSQETILKTDCGVEMAEIERALSRASYRVISWKELRLMMEGKKDEKDAKPLSAVEVASLLGAEVLFQINSLEKSKRTLGKDARWERTYFESNKYGDKLSERSFDDDTRAFLKRSFLEGFESKADLNRLAVTLDATAVLVKNGESMWFYRWTHTDPTAFNYSKTVLVECDNPRLCWATQPLDKNGRKDTFSSGESEAVSVLEKPEDIEKAMYSELLSSVVNNMVSNFSNNRK